MHWLKRACADRRISTGIVIAHTQIDLAIRPTIGPYRGLSGFGQLFLCFPGLNRVEELLLKGKQRAHVLWLEYCLGGGERYRALSGARVDRCGAIGIRVLEG